MILARNIKGTEWIEVVIIDGNYGNGLVEVELYENKYNGARCIVRESDLKIIQVEKIFSIGLESIEDRLSLEKVTILLNIAIRYEKYLHGFNMSYVIQKLYRLKIELI